MKKSFKNRKNKRNITTIIIKCTQKSWGYHEKIAINTLNLSRCQWFSFINALEMAHFHEETGQTCKRCIASDVPRDFFFVLSLFACVLFLFFKEGCWVLIIHISTGACHTTLGMEISTCVVVFVFKTLQIWERFRFQKFRVEILNLCENRKPKSGYQSLDFIEAEKEDESKSN